MPHKSSWISLSVRSFYIFVWVLGIVIFLYLPLVGLLNAGKKTLNIFAWGTTFDPEFFADFEKETGIKLHFSSYETNEELLVKLEALKGSGYDLVIPSDYAVKQLIEKDLLQPLDQEKIASFKKEINPALLGHYFDPESKYTLPLEWGVFGIGIDKDAFSDLPTKSWDLIFNEKLLKQHHPISMADDAKEAIMITALYLFGRKEKLSQEQLKQIADLLIKQKEYVEIYTSMRADYLLATKNIVAGVTTSASMARAMKQYKNIDFFVPEEGSFLTIEHIAIPKGSKKSSLLYQFLQYVYTKKFAQQGFVERGLFPAMTTALSEFRLEPEIKQLLEIDKQQIGKLQFLMTDIPRSAMNEIWISLKAM